MRGGRRRCPACGVVMPKGAARCPTCGHEVGSDLLIVEVGAPSEIGESGYSTPGGGRWDPRRRTGFAILASVAVVVGGLALVGSGGGTEPVEGSEGTSTTERETTTTRRPRSPFLPRSAPTTTAPLSFPPGPVLGEPIGARVVLGRAGDSFLLDLDSAAVAELDLVATSEPGLLRLIPRGGGLVVLDPTQGPGRVEFQPLDGGEPVALGVGYEVFPSDQPERVWLAAFNAAGPVVQEVDLAGAPTSKVATLPSNAWPLGAVNGGLVLNTVDGIFVVDRNGEFRRIATGQGIAAGGEVVLHFACDADLQCGTFVSDVTTGETRVALSDGGFVDPFGFGVGLGSPQPNVDHLAVVRYAEPGPELLLVGVRDGSVTDLGLVSDTPSSVTWSPDGRWLLWLDDQILMAYSPSEDRLLSCELGRRYEFVVAI